MVVLCAYAESAANQQEVTDQLGFQVCQAVEILISAIDHVDQDRNRTLLVGTDEKSKITGSLGADYRDYLVEHIAGGKRGNADLSAYFSCVLVV
jgi:hypothetical protein